MVGFWQSVLQHAMLPAWVYILQRPQPSGDHHEKTVLKNLHIAKLASELLWYAMSLRGISHAVYALLRCYVRLIGMTCAPMVSYYEE